MSASLGVVEWDDYRVTLTPSSIVLDGSARSTPYRRQRLSVVLEQSALEDGVAGDGEMVASVKLEGARSFSLLRFNPVPRNVADSRRQRYYYQVDWVGPDAGEKAQLVSIGPESTLVIVMTRDLASLIESRLKIVGHNSHAPSLAEVAAFLEAQQDFVSSPLLLVRLGDWRLFEEGPLRLLSTHCAQEHDRLSEEADEPPIAIVETAAVAEPGDLTVLNPSAGNWRTEYAMMASISPSRKWYNSRHWNPCLRSHSFPIATPGAIHFSHLCSLGSQWSFGCPKESDRWWLDQSSAAGVLVNDAWLVNSDGLGKARASRTRVDQVVGEAADSWNSQGELLSIFSLRDCGFSIFFDQLHRTMLIETVGAPVLIVDAIIPDDPIRGGTFSLSLLSKADSLRAWRVPERDTILVIGRLELLDLPPRRLFLPSLQLGPNVVLPQVLQALENELEERLGLPPAPVVSSASVPIYALWISAGQPEGSDPAAAFPKGGAHNSGDKE